MTTLTPPSALDCRRGTTLPTTAGSARAHQGLAWHPTDAASVLSKQAARALADAGDLPDPADLLLVRVRPDGATPWRVTLTIQFTQRAPLERVFEFDPRETALDEEGRFAAAFVCVHGPESADALWFPFVRVLDVTEGTPLGHAPTLDVSGFGAGPLPIRLGEASDAPPQRKVLHVLELEDALFRTDSAVVLPGGEDPDGAGSDPDAPLPSGVGVVAVALRHLESNDGQRVLVAGHTDTTGSEQYNLPLSAERAACGLSLLRGDRARFVELALARHQTADYQQILAWAAETFGWPCDPGGVDGAHGPNTAQAIRGFQQAYNQHEHAGNPAGEDLAVDGLLGPKTWGAFFDAYELHLRDELGEDAAGLAALRARVAPLEPASVGCGEHHPIDAVGRDGYRSQLNRRVELLFFDPGEEPDLACHAGPCDPDACALYRPQGEYERRHLPILGNARRWTARWEGTSPGWPGVAQRATPARLVLEAPGMAGQEVTFRIAQEGFGQVAERAVTADDAGAALEFADWFQPASVAERRDYGPDEPFPQVRFQFSASAAGREATSPWLDYADTFQLQLVLEGQPVPDALLTFSSPWGDKEVRTDALGVLRLERLPPGDAVLRAGDVIVLAPEEE